MAIELVYDLDDDYDLEEIRGPIRHQRYLEYECDPTLEDYVDYLLPMKLQKDLSEAWKGNEGVAYRNGLRDGLREFLRNEDWVRDTLDEDDDFREYLKEAYRDEALYSGD